MLQGKALNGVLSRDTVPSPSIPTNYQAPYLLRRTIPTPSIRPQQLRTRWTVPGLVELSVYDLTGRIVSSLVEGVQPAGHHEVRFNADSLPTGTYVYRLRTGAESITRTMTPCAMSKQYKTAAMVAIHETSLGMHEADVIAKETMKTFDEMCLTPVKELTPEDIRAIRQRERASLHQ